MSGCLFLGCILLYCFTGQRIVNRATGAAYFIDGARMLLLGSEKPKGSGEEHSICRRGLVSASWTDACFIHALGHLGRLILGSHSRIYLLFGRTGPSGPRM